MENNALNSDLVTHLIVQYIWLLLKKISHYLTVTSILILLILTLKNLNLKFILLYIIENIFILQFFVLKFIYEKFQL